MMTVEFAFRYIFDPVLFGDDTLRNTFAVLGIGNRSVYKTRTDRSYVKNMSDFQRQVDNHGLFLKFYFLRS